MFVVVQQIFRHTITLNTEMLCDLDTEVMQSRVGEELNTLDVFLKFNAF